MRQERGQQTVRALLVLISFALFLVILVTVAAAPLLEFLGDIFTSSQAVQDASWIEGDGSSLISRYLFVALVAVPLTAFGFLILWVFVWFIKVQSKVGF